MSEPNVKKEFASFGTKALILAIFALCSFTFSIINAFLGIPFVGYVIQIISLILLVLAALNMGKAGNILNNQNLLSFRTKIIVAVIIALIGSILIDVGLSAILLIATGPNPGQVQGYVIFGIILLIGLVLLIVGGVLQILGWSDLKGFFEANMSMFPEDIGIKATSGSRLMMIGAIFYLTFILAIVGFILWVIGYFKLSNLKKLV